MIGPSLPLQNEDRRKPQRCRQQQQARRINPVASFQDNYRKDRHTPDRQGRFFQKRLERETDGNTNIANQGPDGGEELRKERDNACRVKQSNRRGGQIFRRKGCFSRSRMDGEPADCAEHSKRKMRLKRQCEAGATARDDGHRGPRRLPIHAHNKDGE